jgi:predicted RNase H-like HicB family nuclease
METEVWLRKHSALAVANLWWTNDFCTSKVTSMKLRLTAVFRKFPDGYAAFVEELPGANTQGATLEEARTNLAEAVAMVLEANRELSEEELRGQDIIREPLVLA